MNTPWSPEPTLIYCTTAEAADRAIDAILANANGGVIAFDLETAPSMAEAERAHDLRKKLAVAKAEMSVIRKRGDRTDVPGKKAEIAVLQAQLTYAERAALDPHRLRVRLLQLYGGGKHVAVVDLFRTGYGILKRLTGLTLVAHNAAFDLSVLEHHHVLPAEIHCTLQAARLNLGENQTSLANAALAHLGIELDKDEQKSDWSAEPLSQDQINYAARDAVVCWRLFHQVMPALSEQSDAYTIQMQAVPAVARMKLRGFRLDTTAHANMLTALRADRAAAVAEYAQACRDLGHDAALAAVVPSTPNRKEELLTALLSKAELGGWTRTAKSGRLSTRRSILRLAAHYPPIEALTKLATVDKVLTSFGDTLAATISPATGRIHADYKVAGTASGRATCSKPNLQQIPKDKRFRSLFVPDPGNVLVVADYSSMELRAAAHISGDPNMTAAFERGDDLHRITAAKMAGREPAAVTDEERNAAKRVNFGAIYGMGADGLVRSAWESYGTVLSPIEAARWLDAFSAAFPVFARWRRYHANLCQDRQYILIGKDAARGIGRRFPLSRLDANRSPYTVSCNLPVQGACADASMLALSTIDDLLIEHGIDGGPVAWLHDEIVLEVPAEHAALAECLLVEAMERAFAETFPGAPLNGLVEANSGPNWSAAKEKKAV